MNGFKGSGTPPDSFVVDMMGEGGGTLAKGDVEELIAPA